ncbi:MAG: hypothetical protein IPN08_07850 [Bacteroidales bacterium]|nr:hypothetical protein [Bacteroidales bacterium]MBK9357285.1 hypothetical protein [Bacteroidales bacterium]
MKKALILTTTMMVFMALGLKAQFFVGGGLSVSSSSSSTTFGSTTEDNDKSFSFGFYPKAGYFITKKFALGMGIGIGTSKYTEFDSSGDEIITRSNSWEVAPFARFYFKEVGNLSFFGEGVLSVGGSKQINEYTGYEDVTNKFFSISERISPGISYSLSEKIELEAILGSIGSTTSIHNRPAPETNEDYKDVSTSFGLNFGLDDLYFGIIVKL